MNINTRLHAYSVDVSTGTLRAWGPLNLEYSLDNAFINSPASLGFAIPIIAGEAVILHCDFPALPHVTAVEIVTIGLVPGATSFQLHVNDKDAGQYQGADAGRSAVLVVPLDQDFPQQSSVKISSLAGTLCIQCVRVVHSIPFGKLREDDTRDEPITVIEPAAGALLPVGSQASIRWRNGSRRGGFVSISVADGGGGMEISPSTGFAVPAEQSTFVWTASPTPMTPIIKIRKCNPVLPVPAGINVRHNRLVAISPSCDKVLVYTRNPDAALENASRYDVVDVASGAVLLSLQAGLSDAWSFSENGRYLFGAPLMPADQPKQFITWDLTAEAELASPNGLGDVHSVNWIPGEPRVLFVWFGASLQDNARGIYILDLVTRELSNMGRAPLSISDVSSDGRLALVDDANDGVLLNQGAIDMRLRRFDLGSGLRFPFLPAPYVRRGAFLRDRNVFVCSSIEAGTSFLHLCSIDDFSVVHQYGPIDWGASSVKWVDKLISSPDGSKFCVQCTLAGGTPFGLAVYSTATGAILWKDESLPVPTPAKFSPDSRFLLYSRSNDVDAGGGKIIIQQIPDSVA